MEEIPDNTELKIETLEDAMKVLDLAERIQFEKLMCRERRSPIGKVLF